MRLRRTVAMLVLALASLAGLMAAQPTVTICHHPNFFEDPFGFQVTLSVPPSAVQAHLQHGDTRGACGSQPTPRPTIRPTPRPTPRATPRPTPRPTLRPIPTPTPVVVEPMPTPPPTDTDIGAERGRRA